MVELYYRHTPRTCYNMAALAEKGYYDGTVFHRIISDFMIQGGDPTGKSTKSKNTYIYTFIYIHIVSYLVVLLKLDTQQHFFCFSKINQPIQELVEGK